VSEASHVLASRGDRTPAGAIRSAAGFAEGVIDPHEGSPLPRLPAQALPPTPVAHIKARDAVVEL
jgi:hypothetical protein